MPTRRRASERGATLLETALFIPFLLIIIYIVLFISTMLNARASLTAAIGSGVRLAYTRAQVRTVTGTNVDPLIPAVAQFQNNNVSLRTSGLTPLLTLRVDPESAGPFLDALTGRPERNYPGFDFRELPTSFIYAYIFILQSMRQSVGDIKFPCNPDEDDLSATTGSDGPGCLMCEPLHPGGDGVYQGYDSNYGVFESQNRAGGFDTKWIGLECSYRPSNALIGPIERLLGFMGAGGSGSKMIITRRFIYDFPGN
jgi:hypothetical protein